MAVPVEPGEGGGGSGGGTGGSTPPTQPGAKLAFQISSTSLAITSDQITEAGGPWPLFKVRVTPLNASDAGVSQAVDVELPISQARFIV